MELSTTEIAIIIQIVVFTAAGLTAYYSFRNTVMSRISVIETRCVPHNEILHDMASDISVLQTDVAGIKKQNDIFWKVLEPHMAQIIHSPKSVDRDTLVDELVSGTITTDEARKLAEMLEEAVQNNKTWTPEKRFAGVLLLARTRTLLADERKPQ